MRTPDDIGPSFAPRLRSRVVPVEVVDHTILYEEDLGSLHHLDAVATQICARFDGRTSLATIAEALATDVGAEPARVLTDVLDLARELGRRGLLVGVARTTSGSRPR